MSVHVVIPARMASTRLPAKPLVDIVGVPMIVRVAMQATKASVDSVIVAVDDVRVQRVVEEAGYRAVLTAVDHPSGSDRVMEVVSGQGWSEQDIVINVQGDEPLVPPGVIDQLAETMTATAEVDIATLSEPIVSSADFLDVNIVKVVVDSSGDALYFSRAPIPFPRDGEAGLSVLGNEVMRHVGVYGFRVAALKRFVALKDSRLEQIECLEQLRWLEAGGKIRVLESKQSIPGGVDTAEDVVRVEQAVRGSL